MNKKRVLTPCIINGWFSPTYENPRGFSIPFLFAKFRAKPTQLIIHKNVSNKLKIELLNNMKRNKLIFYPIILILGFFLFYKFMTYDRNYTWSKEFITEVLDAVENTDFKIQKTEEINPENIDLPNEKWIKLKIQKILSKVNLMSYGTEHGQEIILNSTKSGQKLICKGWCLSDHLIGIEIGYKNLDSKALTELKERFENQFPNYKIIWTEI